MPWSFAASVNSITPSVSADNWTLDAVSGGIGKITRVQWGGEGTTSTAMQTRIARSNAEATPTTGDVANVEGEGNPTNVIDFVTSYSTPPTLNAADLFSLSWNNHGGIVLWQAFDDAEGWWLITGQTLDLISCRNSVGVGASTYGVSWKEIST